MKSSDKLQTHHLTLLLAYLKEDIIPFMMHITADTQKLPQLRLKLEDLNV
jgi:hypothetical protein